MSTKDGLKFQPCNALQKLYQISTATILLVTGILWVDA